jgi:hypothetical protein
MTAPRRATAVAFCGIAFVAVILVLSLALFPAAPASAAAAHAAAVKIKPTAPTPVGEFPLHCPLKFITGICADGPHRIWVSGEDHGLYAGKIKYRHPYLPSHPAAASTASSAQPTILSNHDLHIRWYHFDKANSPGLASNFITAICVDGKGRLWAGTDRHGVCVFNGKHWRHYSILNGPLGCHVYAIAFNQAADQVWIATENGISIYQCGPTASAGTSPAARSVPRYSPRTWHYITSINHLPPNPDCMAFNSRGMAFVGTLCSGVAIGRPIMQASGPPGARFATRKLTYRWRIVTGPWHMPLTATGYGLPSNLINCVLVGTRRQHIYVGTDLGLAISTNAGESFHYIRGSDYAAKVMGLWHPPIGYRPPPPSFLNKLLPGDHITTLAQDTRGRIWVGTWRNGYAVLNVRTGQMMRSEDEPALSREDGYINRLCPLVLGAVEKDRGVAGGANRQPLANEKIIEAMLIGRYGFGVHGFAGEIRSSASGVMGRPVAGAPNASAAVLTTINPTQFGLPAYAQPPTVAALTRYTRQLSLGTKQASHIRFPWAAPLRMDWVTQGDWAGRYGREYAVLCATGQGISYTCVDAMYPTHVKAYCGPHHHWPFESMREWLTAADTHNPRTLYDPQVGYRQQTNWDDHGEAYPVTFQGPDIWFRVHLKVPGIFRLSFYLYNVDAHAGLYNRQRDWTAEIYRVPHGEGKSLILPPLTAKRFPTNAAAQRYARWAMAARPMAVERAMNVSNPVYLRFALAGPGQYMVRLVGYS